MDSWDGKACKCGHSEPPMAEHGMQAIRDAVAEVDPARTPEGEG